MTALREAAQQALETLEALSAAENIIWVQKRSEIEVEHLRAALAQQEQEPVVFSVTKTGALLEWEPTTGAFALPDGKHSLYTQPPRREWRGLTMQEINALPEIGGVMWRMGSAVSVLGAVRAVEAALKEKNNG